MYKITYSVLITLTLVLLIHADVLMARTNFYSSGVIDSGFAYDSVYTWNNAVVDMNGAEIQSLDTFNYSVVNINSGKVNEGLSAWNYSTVNIFNDEISWFLEAHDSSEINIYGGSISDWLYAADSSVVNIYGYGFIYDPLTGSKNGGQLRGYWLSGQSFTIDLLDNIEFGSTYYDHINLIPEPCTISLLALGGVALRLRSGQALLRKRRR